jgi:hypothetical protein
MTEKFMHNISLRAATSDDAAFALHVTEAHGMAWARCLTVIPIPT